MSGQLVRLALRWMHILCALLVGAVLYSPLKANEMFMTLTLFVLVPVVAITGVMMWKQRESHEVPSPQTQLNHLNGDRDHLYQRLNHAFIAGMVLRLSIF